MFGYEFGLLKTNNGDKLIKMKINVKYLADQLNRPDVDSDDLYSILQDYNLYGIFRDAIDEILDK